MSHIIKQLIKQTGSEFAWIIQSKTALNWYSETRDPIAQAVPKRIKVVAWGWTQTLNRISQRRKIKIAR